MVGCGTAVVLGAVGRSVHSANRTLSLGIVMAAGSFGQFIMVPSISYLIEIFGWSYSLFLLSFVASIMIIFSFFLNFSEKSESSKSGTSQTLTEAIKEAFKSKSFNLLSLGFFVCGFHVTFVAVHLINIVILLMQLVNFVIINLRIRNMMTGRIVRMLLIARIRAHMGLASIKFIMIMYIFCVMIVCICFLLILENLMVFFYLSY